VLERYKSRRHHFGFNLFASSQAYANVLFQIQTIIMKGGQQNQACLISLTGLEKLDDTLNAVKVVGLACYNLLLEFVLN